MFPLVMITTGCETETRFSKKHFNLTHKIVWKNGHVLSTEFKRIVHIRAYRINLPEGNNIRDQFLLFEMSDESHSAKQVNVETFLNVFDPREAM